MVTKKKVRLSCQWDERYCRVGLQVIHATRVKTEIRKTEMVIRNEGALFIRVTGHRKETLNEPGRS